MRPKTVSHLVDGYTPINNLLWQERSYMKTEDLQAKLKLEEEKLKNLKDQILNVNVNIVD